MWYPETPQVSASKKVSTKAKLAWLPGSQLLCFWCSSLIMQPGRQVCARCLCHCHPRGRPDLSSSTGSYLCLVSSSLLSHSFFFCLSINLNHFCKCVLWSFWNFDIYDIQGLSKSWRKMSIMKKKSVFCTAFKTLLWTCTPNTAAQHSSWFQLPVDALDAKDDGPNSLVSATM